MTPAQTEPADRARRSSWSVVGAGVAVLVLALTMVAFRGAQPAQQPTTPQSPTAQGPREVVVAYLAAVTSGDLDAATTLTCDSLDAGDVSLGIAPATPFSVGLIRRVGNSVTVPVTLGSASQTHTVTLELVLHESMAWEVCSLIPDAIVED